MTIRDSHNFQVNSVAELAAWVVAVPTRAEGKYRLNRWNANSAGAPDLRYTLETAPGLSWSSCTIHRARGHRQRAHAALPKALRQDGQRY